MAWRRDSKNLETLERMDSRLDFGWISARADWGFWILEG
jgi:hypothetical protein